jgi:hypothetical protein
MIMTTPGKERISSQSTAEMKLDDDQWLLSDKIVQKSKSSPVGVGFSIDSRNGSHARKVK